MITAKNRGELTITLRMKGRPVVLVGEGPVADEHRTMLTQAGAVIVAEGSKATFAVVVDDRAAVSRLKMRGALVYAVGEPDLCDFIPASEREPAKPPKRARKVKFAPEFAPDPLAEVPPDRVPETPRERPITAHREPMVRPPREPLKLPSISLEPALRALASTRSWAVTLWTRAQAKLSPMLRMSTPLTRSVASTIQARVERARARPISLDMALVKGGPLDDQAPANGTATGAQPPQTAAQ